MIRVERRPEPTAPEFDFHATVRVPGNAWLAANPTKPASKMPALWREASPSLRKSYKGVCAYFCCFVMPATGGSSTDHFVPKSKARDVAYEWDNYRFACSRMNARKRDASDVLDPFDIEDGWFVLAFTTMRVKPASGLGPADLQRVEATIQRLELNSPECVTERALHWDNYEMHGLSVERLVMHAPFIAMEAARQGLLRSEGNAVSVATLRAIFDA